MFGLKKAHPNVRAFEVHLVSKLLNVEGYSAKRTKLLIGTSKRLPEAQKGSLGFNSFVETESFVAETYSLGLK